MNPSDFETVPLGPEAHYWARYFAGMVRSRQHCIYSNTLAVYAVHAYLQHLKVETDLASSNSWRILGSFLQEKENANEKFALSYFYESEKLNSTELILPLHGSLNCQAVFSGQRKGVLLPTSDPSLLGHAFVCLENSLQSGKILGFSPRPSSKLPVEVDHEGLLSASSLLELSLFHPD